MIIQDNIFTLKTEHDIKWYEVDFLRILKLFPLPSLVKSQVVQSLVDS